MTANKEHKEFDAVRMMRDIRDQLDREIANMTFAEEKAYLKKMLAKSPRSMVTPTRERIAK